jgi:hypothetical protein
MKSLKTLGGSAVLVLTFAFAVAAQSPSCWSPGQVEGPPCSVTQPISDDTVLNAEPNLSSVAVAVESALTEAALGVLQSVLLIQ